MSAMTFTITKEDIYDRLFATSAYASRSREAMGIPSDIIERMQATADEKKIIEPLIDSSVDDAYTHIARYFPGSTSQFTGDTQNGKYTFYIPTPTEYPSGNSDRLKRCITSFIVNRTLQAWYTDVKPDEASIAATKAQSDAANIVQLLTQRTRPIKIYDDIIQL